MLSIKNSAEQFNSFMSELKGKKKDWVKQEVEARLEREVEQWLHRQPYKRRKCVRGQKTQAQCNRCGARYAGRFSRNGHRSRQLVTCVGVLDVWLPRAALQVMYPHIPHQRCLFHKFHNLWHAIRPPANLPRQALLAFKRTLFQQVRTVFYASSPLQATQRRDAFCTQWQTDQPELVASLSRDWHEAIAFFRILTRFPPWPLRYLRTTSLLERINRKIRHLFRAASAFHSAAGLLATAARILDPLRLT